jgi:hypothetical protein
MMTDTLTRPEYLALVASWPISARQAFGVRANHLTPEGLVGWQSAERQAFAEVSARLAAGEFRESTPVRVLITGDRHWICPDLARRVVADMVARYGSGLVIVAGAATGVDRSFLDAAVGLGVAAEPHPADWERFGRGAGPIRNQVMVDLGARFALAVHRDLAGSLGTGDCVRRCLAARIPVWLIDSEAGQPRRLERIPSPGQAGLGFTVGRERKGA